MPDIRSAANMVTNRIARFLDESSLPTPLLVVDGAVVADRLRQLQQALPEADVFYAVKANPLPEVLRLLVAGGAGCDVASGAEIRMCLEAGATPARISFGNTVKRARDIAYAHERGIDLFAFDSEQELEKIAQHAPGSRVFVRLLTSCESAEWPLSRKFGCDPAMAYELLRRAKRLGLRPYGVSFHVGSQQTDPAQWDAPIADCAQLFRRLVDAGIDLELVNLGGGLPARYDTDLPGLDEYAAAIRASLRRHFGASMPNLMIEPGRFLVAEAGVIETEVLLVSRKSEGDAQRWVYIDCGKFGGLAETMNEAIRYPFIAPERGSEPALAVVAGPTCDSADILYEQTPVSLPQDLRAGDRLRILSAGAYTFTYASISFNGIGPLRAVFLP